MQLTVNECSCLQKTTLPFPLGPSFTDSLVVSSSSVTVSPPSGSFLLLSIGQYTTRSFGTRTPLIRGCGEIYLVSLAAIFLSQRQTLDAPFLVDDFVKNRRSVITLAAGTLSNSVERIKKSLRNLMPTIVRNSRKTGLNHLTLKVQWQDLLTDKPNVPHRERNAIKRIT